MHELAVAALAAITPYLPMLYLPLPGEAGGLPATSPEEEAAGALAQLIESAFARIGEQALWNSFVNDPSDASAAEPVLAAALRGDEALAARMEGAVRQVEDNSRSRQDWRNIRAGGDVTGRDKITRNHADHRKSYGGLIAVIAVVVVAVVALLAGGRAILDAVTDRLTLGKDSTCAEFLRAPQEQQLTAMREVGLEIGARGIGSPLALPAISYECSGHPDETLGEAVGKYKNSF
ncbi:hypothetical protein [Actinoplanes sp. NPDC023714]|uniref:hypothetical protein n=1 Tax=Actinoplanes sp. NPDC023714 TaxID=3154322 RepID=UPI0033D4520F